jgi:hypothetical protein
MVYKNANNEWIGVLNDYDLSSTQQDGPSGDKHTGTIPFMEIDLLEEEAIEGKAQHSYQHDVSRLPGCSHGFALDMKMTSSKAVDLSMSG